MGRRGDGLDEATVAPTFSLARAAWMPCVVIWDAQSGEFKRIGVRVSARRRPRREPDMPEQLPLPAPAPTKPRRETASEPEQAAKAYIARRGKPSVVPGRVKLTFTLDMPRELAERLNARAIREEKNLEAVVMDLLAVGTEKGTR